MFYSGNLEISSISNYVFSSRTALCTQLLATMPSYKLYYFNGKGRAEPLRWMLVQSGTDFEDCRIPREDWSSRKSEFPFHQLPVLEVTADNGELFTIPQSYAIARYLGRELGFDAKSNLNKAKCDAFVDQLHDSFAKLPFRESNMEKRDKAFKEAIDGTFGQQLLLLENYLLGNGFVAGDSLTWADFTVACACEFLTDIIPTAINKTPKLKVIFNAVTSLPKIKEWIEKRPDPK